MIKSIKDFEFQNVWKTDDQSLLEEIRQYWIDNRVVRDSQEQDKRLLQVVYTIRYGGDIVGVSTAYKLLLKFIGHYFYCFRCHINKEFRAPALDTNLIIKTRDFLESIWQEDGDPKCVGLVLIVQNKTLQNAWRYAVWPDSEMAYIGKDQKGNHIRIYYFDKARI